MSNIRNWNIEIDRKVIPYIRENLRTRFSFCNYSKNECTKILKYKYGLNVFLSHNVCF